VKKNNLSSKQPIGIFDSGVGGLTVLRAIEKIMPNEDIVYFGDTARVPYGNKTASTIKKFSIENVLFLLEQNVKMVVVACNTSSALVLNHLKGIFNIPILGVVEAGAREALKVTAGKIGVIGTESTIRSKSYQKAISLENKKIKVIAKSCPLFVPLVEEGFLDGEITRLIVRMYLQNLKKNRIDTIILGCTHYPLLKKVIADFLSGVKLIDSAEAAAKESKNALKRSGLENKARRAGNKKFFVSDEAKKFLKLAKLFLKRPISKPRMIDV